MFVALEKKFGIQKRNLCSRQIKIVYAVAEKKR